MAIKFHQACCWTAILEKCRSTANGSDGVADSTGRRNGKGGAHLRDVFKAKYGPTMAVYSALADQPERAAELDGALAELGDRWLQDGRIQAEYLLVTATRS